MPENTAASDAPATGTTPVTNRRFIALVRAKLDADGHRDIAIDRQWIDEDTPGYPFLLNVPVGPGLVVPLKPRDAFFKTEDLAYLASHVEHFAKALVTLRQAERMLLKYAADMRRAAGRAIAAARAEGLDVLLADVTLKPTYAWHLTGSSWKDAAYHVLAVVGIRHTSLPLQPTVSEIYVEEPEHVAAELRDILEDQRERQARLAHLDGLGADLLVDAITLDLLRAHVADVGQVLRDVWKKQHVSVPIQHEGRETRLSLTTSNGCVESGLELDGAYWNGECVWLVGQNVEDGLDLVGKTLADKVRHPALSSRTVIRIDRSPPEVSHQDIYHLDKGPTSLFDADTGRIWQLAERLAA